MLDNEGELVEAAKEHAILLSIVNGLPDAVLLGDLDRRLIERDGGTDKPILIQGESGTGKERVARALHQASIVADKPLVIINCAALSENLLESELFGHEKGSFTGVTASKEGLFELADGGTLFIDEIGEMPGSLQAKLLRVLEDGWLRRVGATKERKVNVRIVSAVTQSNAKSTVATSESPIDQSEPLSHQREHVIAVLQQCGGNKARAARSLGVSRRTFYRLLDKHDISIDKSD